MAVYKPPLVVIAPKGEKYSSVSDEGFTSLNDPVNCALIELTIEQYGKWVIEAPSLSASYKRTGSGVPGSAVDTGLTLRRYKLSGYQNTGQIQDFPGMAPGHFSASMPSTSYFRATDGDINQDGTGAGVYRYFLASDAFNIKPFYHKDKFYLCWYGGAQRPNTQVTITPTTLKIVYISGSTATIQYSLNT